MITCNKLNTSEDWCSENLAENAHMKVLRMYANSVRMEHLLITGTHELRDMVMNGESVVIQELATWFPATWMTPLELIYIEKKLEDA